MSNYNEGPGYDPKNLQVVYFALLSAQLFFLFLTVYIIEDADFLYRINDLTYTAIPLAALVLDIIGNKVFTNGFNKLTMLREIDKAMQKLHSIHLIRWVLVEGATLLLICFSIITANHFFSAFAAANIVYFFTLRPKIFTFNEGF
jgi:hypothetical protein